jgi:hypothetical protein
MVRVDEQFALPMPRAENWIFSRNTALIAAEERQTL